jgi:hypothetical protein
MRIFNLLLKKKAFDTRLKGAWSSDPNDQITKNNFGNVYMLFTADGKLFYEIEENDKIQRINLTYWTEKDKIITDQPSHPNQEISSYKFESNDILIIEFGGINARFKRTKNK